MNRREVVAITVIINIVVLSVLFFTAQRLEEDPADLVAAPLSQPEPQVEQVVAAPQSKPVAASFAKQTDVPVDEVDTVLRDFAAAVAASQQQQPQQKVIAELSPAPSVQPSPVIERPVASVPTVPPSNIVEVVVKKGDFLQKIAKQNGSTIEAIKIANNMKNDQLKVGQVLRVPLIASVQSEKPAAAPVYPQGNTYKVKSGDSPWKIAKQHNVSLDDLLKLNSLDEESAKNLKPGDTIRVP